MAIEHINEFDTLNAGREKINKHAIDPANRAELNSIDAKSVANQANQTSQSAEAIAINTDDRLDNIIAGEMQDAEVIDARRPFGSEAYATLGERLDKSDAQLAQTTNQIKGSEYNIFSFGGVGDGITSDVQALRNTIAAADVNDTVFLPSGYRYAIDDTVLIDKPINFVCEGTIVYTGIRDRACIHFNRLVSKTIKIFKVSDKTVDWHGWDSDDYIGILFENLYFCNIDIANSVENFTVGIRCLASGGQARGFFFNEFNITQLKNNRINLEVYKKDPNSWFNSNVFKKFAVSYEQSGTGFQTAVVDRYGIKQTFENNTTPCDTNIFYDIRFDTQSSFGGTYTAIKLERAWSWKFENYRSELVSGPNVKTIVLDCASNNVRGLIFNPVFEAFTSPDNAKVHLLNVVAPLTDYRGIYKKTGTASNVDMLPLYEDKDFNKRYRQHITDNHMIDMLYRYKLNGTLLSDVDELVGEYATGNRLLENGVNIGSTNLGVLYLKGLQQGDTFTVNLKTAVIPWTPAIHLKAWDISDVLIDNNELVVSNVAYKALTGANTYWDATNKRLTQSSQRPTLTFSVNREEVKTVAILFSGGLNGIQISSNRHVNVLKSVVPNRNNFPHHVLNSVPTKKIDGKFLPGDKVYNSNNTIGQPIGWELKDVSGVLQWVSLGNY